MVSLAYRPVFLPRDLLPRLLAWGAMVLLGALIASTYFGRSPSPYGTCYGVSGRTIPCDLVTRGATPHRPPNER